MADIYVHCPHCSAKSSVKEEWGGKSVRCPNCYKLFALPEFASQEITLQPASPRRPSPVVRQVPSPAQARSVSRASENSGSSSGNTVGYLLSMAVKLMVIALLAAGGAWLYFKLTALTPESLGGNELNVMTRKRANRGGAGGIAEIARLDFYPIVSSKKNFFYRNVTFQHLWISQKEHDVFSGTISFVRDKKIMIRPIEIDRRSSFSIYKFPFKYSENEKYLLEDADMLFELATVVDKSLKEWKFQSASVAGKGILSCSISKNGTSKSIYLEAEQIIGKDNIGRVWVKVLKALPTP